MKYPITVMALLIVSIPGRAQVYEFEGTWVTTNRPLEGKLNCVITHLGNEKWVGDFDGEWEGVAFSYKVEFSGPPEKLQGTAVIDGANYHWNGRIYRKEGWFTASFTGDRYTGSFRLKLKSTRISSASVPEERPHLK